MRMLANIGTGTDVRYKELRTTRELAAQLSWASALKDVIDELDAVLFYSMEGREADGDDAKVFEEEFWDVFTEDNRVYLIESGYRTQLVYDQAEDANAYCAIGRGRYDDVIGAQFFSDKDLWNYLNTLKIVKQND